MNRSLVLCAFVLICCLFLVVACDDDSDGDVAYVIIHNDFDNQDMEYQPPWTICHANYMGVEFGHIDIGQQSAELEVEPGLDNVLMVVAWQDPECNPENCLPVASRNEEEVVTEQHRTIAINMPNHQGPCPPEGVQPIPEELYNRVLELYPEYDFKPYSERTENTQCLDK